MSDSVTIITPVYNGVKYLDRYFDSIKNIDYYNLEIIIVNDGSTDESLNVIKKRRMIDNRIILINKEKNEGVSKARNEALKLSHGKWIFFFDCDDTVESSIVSDCVSLTKISSDTVCYNYASARLSGDIIPHIFSYSQKEYCREDILNKVLPHSFGISIDELLLFLSGKREMREGKELNGPWRMMYSAEIIKKKNLQFDENLKIGEDTIFTNEYLAMCERIIVLNKVLYYLYENENSTINNYHKNTIDMIDGKIKLINAKKLLTERLRKEGLYVYSLWGGEYILSSVQIALLLANNVKGIKQKVNILKKYHLESNVVEQWKRLTYKDLWKCKTIKAIPIFLLKNNMLIITEVLMSLMSFFGIKISE